MGLKSPHIWAMVVNLQWLKSDHYGIEISSHVTVQVATPNVKIRPLWD